MIAHLTNLSKINYSLFNIAVAITAPIRGSSREKFYHELGLGPLKSRQWYLKLFFRLKKNKHPSYLFDIIPNVLSTWTTRNHNSIHLFNAEVALLRLRKFSPN